MFKRICKLLSAVLVFALFLQMLPLQVFALNYRARLSDKITLPNISATESVTAAIGEEIPANRTAFSKEYKLENGLHMAAVYANQVHYETADGWEEIDNTLKLAEGSYVNTAGLWQVALPQQLSRDSRISISKDGYTLRFGMSGQLRLDDSVAVMSATAEPSTKIEQMGISQAQVSPKNLLAEDTPAHMAVLSEKNHSRLSYGNVYENTNVIYDLQGSKVKESVILAAHDSDLVGYRYVLETGELAPVLKEDGSIGFYDAEKRNVVMIMEAPFLVDNNGEYTNDIRVTLTGKDGIYYLSYYLPRQWLAQSERAWPVILDPVISANNIVTNINDITVAENTTFSSIWGINEAGYSNKRGVEWFFLKYLSLPTLGSADMIVNAQVQLYKPQNSSNYASIEVRKVLDDWNTNTTWATRPLISQGTRGRFSCPLTEAHPATHRIA